jgi:hypothetical protein
MKYRRERCEPLPFLLDVHAGGDGDVKRCQPPLTSSQTRYKHVPVRSGLAVHGQKTSGKTLNALASSIAPATEPA